DDDESSGPGHRHAVSLSDLHALARTGGDGARGHRRPECAGRVHGADRDAGRAVRRVLHGTRVSPGLLPQQSDPGLLPGHDRPQGAETARQVRVAVEGRRPRAVGSFPGSHVANPGDFIVKQASILRISILRAVVTAATACWAVPALAVPTVTASYGRC